MEVDDLEFHYFIKFNFNNIEGISHNHQGYTAAYSKDNTVVIWKNDTFGPNLEEGKIISIIVNQFEQIDQIQWVYGTNNLLICEGERLYLWDIFKNKQERTFLSTEPILYAKKISLGILLVKESGKFSLFKGNVEITSQISSDIIIDVPEGIYIYPTLFFIREGEWVEEEITMSWSERGLRRNFEGNNDIQINGDMLQLDETDFEDLELPEKFKHNFEDVGVTILLGYDDGFLVRSKSYGLFVQNSVDGEEKDAIIIHGNQQILRNQVISDRKYYTVRSNLDEERVYWRSNQLIREDLRSDLLNKENLLENIPPYFYLDFNQDVKHVQFNKKHKFLWFPDLTDDFAFLDLLQFEGSIFTNFGRDHRSYFLIQRWGKLLLQWQRGANYPSGKLQLYNLEEPTKKPQVLYDEEIHSKRLDYQEFKTGSEDLDFPLLLPHWHQVELWVYYEEPIFSQKLSYSQYFFMVERLSKSDNAAILEYQDHIPKEIAFIHFGDLKLELEGKPYVFEKISPEWTFHPATGLLAYYSIDGFCYIINTFDPHLLPVYHFESNLPYLLEFSPNGQYLVAMSFKIQNTTLNTHPESDGPKHFEVEFPYVKIEIHQIFRKKSYAKSVRFPQLLEFKEINVEYFSDRIHIFLPSYTDNREESVVMFDFSNEKFHYVSGTEFYRLWMTHSQNSPVSRFEKGKEYYLERHPEISRDYSMRPFRIFEGVLVRKEDQLALTMADINLEEIPQKSTLDIYNLEGTVSLEVPFYYNNSMKPIFIDEDKLEGINLKEFYKLDQMKEIPSKMSFQHDKVPRNRSLRLRYVKFFKALKERKQLHSKQGIAFESSQYQEFEILVDKLISEYE